MTSDWGRRDGGRQLGWVADSFAKSEFWSSKFEDAQNRFLQTGYYLNFSTFSQMYLIPVLHIILEFYENRIWWEKNESSSPQHCAHCCPLQWRLVLETKSCRWSIDQVVRWSGGQLIRWSGSSKGGNSDKSDHPFLLHLCITPLLTNCDGTHPY